MGGREELGWEEPIGGENRTGVLWETQWMTVCESVSKK